jgi:hypothetical protein
MIVGRARVERIGLRLRRRLAPRSRRITGSAVVTTRLSSVTMKSAIEVIANVQSM